MSKDIRFTYATRPTRDAAEDCLEDCWATGEISPSDNPDIVKRGAVYHVTLRDPLSDYA